jgi:hypothetical protein
VSDGGEKETWTNDEKPVGEEARGARDEGRHVESLMDIRPERKELATHIYYKCDRWKRRRGKKIK